MGGVRFELTIPWFRTKIERYKVEGFIESYQARLPSHYCIAFSPIILK